MPTLLVLLPLAALAALVVWRDRRAAQARAQLSQQIHDLGLRLDQRCDHLQRQLDTLERRQRVAHLGLLVNQVIDQEQLAASQASDLRSAIRQLDTDATTVTTPGAS